MTWSDSAVVIQLLVANRTLLVVVMVIESLLNHLAYSSLVFVN